MKAPAKFLLMNMFVASALLLYVAPASANAVSVELRRAFNAYQLGQFKEAAEIFESEFSKTNRPNLLYNAARCRFRLKQWRRTRLLLQRYLKKAEGQSDLADAKKLLAEVWVNEEVWVAVRSDPADARVYWQEKFIGKSPQRFKAKRGKYTVRLEHPSCLTLKQNVKVAGLDEVEIIGLVLKKKATTGELDIRSSPVGLDVFLANKRLGSTPLRREVAKGRHELRLEQHGRVLYHADIDITVSKRLTVEHKFDRARRYRTLFWSGIAAAAMAVVAEGFAVGLTVDANARFDDDPVFAKERSAAIGLHVGAALSAAVSVGLFIWQALGSDLEPASATASKGKQSWRLDPAAMRVVW